MSYRLRAARRFLFFSSPLFFLHKLKAVLFPSCFALRLLGWSFNLFKRMVFCSGPPHKKTGFSLLVVRLWGLISFPLFASFPDSFFPMSQSDCACRVLRSYPVLFPPSFFTVCSPSDFCAGSCTWSLPPGLFFLHNDLCWPSVHALRRSGPPNWIPSPHSTRFSCKFPPLCVFVGSPPPPRRDV